MRKTEIENRARLESRRITQAWLEQLAADDGSDRKTVYLFTSGDVSELLRAFDFRVVLPELIGVQYSVRKCAVQMMHRGEALGYPPDICGYVKADLGLMTGPPAGDSPIGQIPPPDLLVATHGGCFTHIKWFEALGAHFDCPLFVLDIPFITADKPSAFDRGYVRGQLEELIGLLEETTGKRLDIDTLQTSLELTRQAVDLWREILRQARNRPAPFDAFFDAASYMAPMTILRGTQACVDYYRATLNEIEDRAKHRLTPVGQERFRLLFDGPPPWPRLREFRQMFENWGAVGVAATYSGVTTTFDEIEDQADPLDFLTELALHGYLNWNLGKRRTFVETLAKDFSVDGVVIHSVRSCRPYSVGQLDMRNYLAEEAGMPTLFVDSDLVDPRYFSSAQIMNRIDTFFEALNRRKEAARRPGQGA